MKITSLLRQVHMLGGSLTIQCTDVPEIMEVIVKAPFKGGYIENRQQLTTTLLDSCSFDIAESIIEEMVIDVMKQKP